MPFAPLVTDVELLDISSAKQGSAVRRAAARNVIVFIVISPMGCNGRGRCTDVNCSPRSQSRLLISSNIQ